MIDNKFFTYFEVNEALITNTQYISQMVADGNYNDSMLTTPICLIGSGYNFPDKPNTNKSYIMGETMTSHEKYFTNQSVGLSIFYSLSGTNSTYINWFQTEDSKNIRAYYVPLWDDGTNFGICTYNQIFNNYVTAHNASDYGVVFVGYELECDDGRILSNVVGIELLNQYNDPSDMMHFSTNWFMPYISSTTSGFEFDFYIAINWMPNVISYNYGMCGYISYYIKGYYIPPGNPKYNNQSYFIKYSQPEWKRARWEFDNPNPPTTYNYKRDSTHWYYLYYGLKNLTTAYSSSLFNPGGLFNHVHKINFKQNIEMAHAAVYSNFYPAGNTNFKRWLCDPFVHVLYAIKYKNIVNNGADPGLVYIPYEDVFYYSYETHEMFEGSNGSTYEDSDLRFFKDHNDPSYNWLGCELRQDEPNMQYNFRIKFPIKLDHRLSCTIEFYVCKVVCQHFKILNLPLATPQKMSGFDVNISNQNSVDTTYSFLQCIPFSYTRPYLNGGTWTNYEYNINFITTIQRT